MTRGEDNARDRGAAIVETLLVLPMLLMLLLGIVEFGRVYNAQLSVSHAAREAVRFYALEGELTAADDATGNNDGRWASGIAQATAPNLAITVSANPTCDPNDFGDVGTPTTIIVDHTISFNIPFWQGGTFDLTGIGTMRCGG